MSEIPRGAIRFNTDSNKPELWDGSQWAEFQLSTPNLGQSSDTQPGARGVFVGGRQEFSPQLYVDTIEYINISSTGNAIDFGNLSAVKGDGASCSSSTRGLFAGSNSGTNTIEFFTISSTGDAQDFGDLTSGTNNQLGALAGATRGIFMGGRVGSPAVRTNIIDYVTIASLGDAKDFGDLTNPTNLLTGCASPTRGVIMGGQNPGSTNTIEFITLSTLGNAQDFGDLTAAKFSSGGCSNPTRGLYGGSNPITNVIEFVTIATLGNAQNFGDLTNSVSLAAACSSPTRGVWGGGYSSPVVEVDVIQYVNISTEGDAVDFGNLSNVRYLGSACSNAHGGL
jgi:hypothetical protein